MAVENGNGRSGDEGDIVLDIAALKIKVEHLEDEHSSHEAILQTMANTDRLLSERIIVLEVHEKTNSEVLKKLQKESSLQTKLLGAILTALIAAAVHAVLKS